MLQATRRSFEPAASARPARKLPSLPWKKLALHAGVNLVLAAGVVALVLGASKACQQWRHSTAIASVQIVGDFDRVDAGALRAQLARAVAGGYFTADLGAIRDAAMQTPWVENAVVSRHWPNILQVRLSEKQAVARWGDKGLVSTRGDVFMPPVLNPDAGLPLLFGPAGKARDVMEQYSSMSSILHGLGLQVLQLQLTDRMTWFLQLNNGIQLVVDNVDTIAKMQRFAFLYQRQLAPDAERIASVDLRYRNGVAVGWKLEKSLKKAKSGV